MLTRKIIGKDGKKSNMDPKARPAKVMVYEDPLEKLGGKRKEMGTKMPRSRKPPGPPPVKKAK